MKQLELNHWLDVFKYKIPCKLSRRGLFDLDLEYPDSRYNRIGHISTIYISDNGTNIFGELSLDKNFSTDFEFKINDESCLDIILRPLSDLTNEIEHNGEKFVPVDIIFPEKEYKTPFDRKVAIEALKLQEVIGFSCTYFSIVQKLKEWNFDIDGLIEKKLAIDINTL